MVGVGMSNVSGMHAAPAVSETIRQSYELVAEHYDQLADEQVGRPLERGMLLAFAELVIATGPGLVGDVGCGPGHLCQHLAALGLDMTGVDLSPRMIERARARCPEVPFAVGDMFALPAADGAWAGALSTYTTFHYGARERGRAFRELARVVRPGGWLMHTFYVSAPGQPPGSTYELETWFGQPVALPVRFVGIQEASAELDEVGFETMSTLIREPLDHTDLPARRCTILARRGQ